MRVLSLKKKGISPLVATILLIAFALVIGTVTMNWGKAYAEKDDSIKEKSSDGLNVGGNFNSAILINYDLVDSPLKELQIKYLTGKISLEEYLAREKELVGK